MQDVKQTNTMVVSYERLSALSKDDLTTIDTLQVVLLESNPNSIITVLKRDKEAWVKMERYDSLKEFSTVSMKELLTLYIKRQVIKSDPLFYKQDDPRVHAFLSKLAYAGIKYVSEHIDEFALEFKTGNIKMRIPRGGRNDSTKRPVKK